MGIYAQSAHSSGHGCGTFAALAVKNVYEGSVKARAFARAGANPHINGHVLEIMGGDKTNLNPGNWVRGIAERQTASTTAKAVDAVVMKGGKVMSRIQYKDTPHSLGETIRAVKNGQYRSTTLRGTHETAKTFNAWAEKHGVGVRMQDSGISSKTTTSLGRAMGSCRHLSLHTACWNAAKSSGAVGAVVGGGLSAVTNISKVIRGEKDGFEAVGCVVKDTAGAYVTGAGSCYAATAAGAGAAAACGALGITGGVAAACTIGAPFVAAAGVGWLIHKGWKKLFG